MFEKRDIVIITLGIVTALLFFGLTVYFRSGAF
jgi:hypothetical protein